MLVTIYTPTKNRQESLARAVDSVLNQTYRDIELIVVNDGSTDGTGEYLKNRAKRDARLKYFNKSVSEGAPAARNLAIEHAEGHFITGLDDDDEFLPIRIQAFVDFWEMLSNLGYKPSCLYSQDIVTRHGEVYFTSKKKGMVTVDDLFEFNYIGNQVFAPKSHFIDAGLYNKDLPAWQDLEMFIRLLQKFGTAHLLDCATQIYDDSPKQDRISINAETKIRNAYKQIVNAHASNSPSNAQKLIFQMFSKYYGIHPKIVDWIIFMKLGFWPKGLLKMVASSLRL